MDNEQEHIKIKEIKEVYNYKDVENDSHNIIHPKDTEERGFPTNYCQAKDPVRG